MSDLIVTILLAGDRPPFRTLWEGRLPAVPDAGEPISFNQRQYRVLERSWRFGTALTPTETALGPMNGPATVQVGVGLLVEQIAGARHIDLVSG